MKSLFEAKKDGQRQHSFYKDRFRKAYDEWDKTDDKIVFNVRTTSNEVKSIGIEDKKMYGTAAKL